MNISDSQQPPDVELVLGISQGDSACETELVCRYQARLVAFCCSRTDRTRGQDIAQDVWAKILPKFRSGKYDGENVMSLLCQTARNLVIDQHRRPAENMPNLDPNASAALYNATNTPLNGLLNAEEMQIFTDCQKRLKKLEQDVLDKTDGPVVVEPAERNRIYKRRHSAMKKMRDCVQNKLNRGER